MISLQFPGISYPHRKLPESLQNSPVRYNINYQKIRFSTFKNRWKKTIKSHFGNILYINNLPNVYKSSFYTNRTRFLPALPSHAYLYYASSSARIHQVLKCLKISTRKSTNHYPVLIIFYPCEPKPFFYLPKSSQNDTWTRG